MRLLEQQSLLMPSTTQRLPRKTCGLFDTGFAGDAVDVASLGLGVPADIDQSIFTFEDPTSSTSQEPSTGGIKHNALLKVDAPVASGLDDWNFDLLDPLGDLEDPLLGDLEDPLADSSLDAFVNLEPFLMENTFFDDGNQIEKVDEPAEVEPIINFNTTATDLFSLSATLVETQTTASKPKVKATRKRKNVASKSDDSVFKVPDNNITIVVSDPNVDHDYITKAQGLSSPCENVEKRGISNKGKSTLKRKRVSSTASNDSEVSSTSSTIDPEDLDQSMDKQSIRRIKNNIASKRSREQRKQKFVDMDNEAEELIQANDGLRKKIVELEKLAKEMKELLVAKMAGKA